MAYLIGNRNDGRANAGNEKHTPGPEAESVSHVPHVCMDKKERPPGSRLARRPKRGLVEHAGMPGLRAREAFPHPLGLGVHAGMP